MKTALVIDDESSFRTVLTEFLKKEGWKVVAADDGDIGTGLALEHHPQVIICDLRMPRCNGIEVCRFVRQRPELHQTKIIVTSGIGAFERDRLDALAAGADEYLLKPLNLSDLSSLLIGFDAKEVDEPAAPPNSAVRFGTRTRIKFWGVRGSVPTPGPATVFYGGNTSCVEVDADGEIIILDAGTGIRPLGLDLAARFKDKPMNLTLLISHTHWDHIQGFPFFLPAYDSKNRLRILGFQGSRDGLGTTLTSQMESPYFPVGLREMPGHIVIEELQGLNFEIGRVLVQAAFLNHPGICVGYRLNTTAGSIGYLPDNEPSQPLRAQLLNSANGTPESLDYGRMMDQKLAQFIRGCDVLIADSQFDAEEYKTHAGWGHGCVDDVVELALNAGVHKLFLFHHDPSHDDLKVSSMVAHAKALVTARGASLSVDAAREGLEFILSLDGANQTKLAQLSGREVGTHDPVTGG
jgi:phosphoribosyl 1,2-cyclic phosphodiesterase/ActR/RegA family two-component response regulator